MLAWWLRRGANNNMDIFGVFPFSLVLSRFSVVGNHIYNKVCKCVRPCTTVSVLAQTFIKPEPFSGSMKRPPPPSAPNEIEEMEDAAAEMANSINYGACKDMGVTQSFLDEWMEGVVLTGAEGTDPYFLDDYPNVKDNAEVAAAELDRLTKRQKIFWYPEGAAPSNVSVCPANLNLDRLQAQGSARLVESGLE